MINKLIVSIFLLFNFCFISLSVAEESISSQSQEDLNLQKTTLIRSIETIFTKLGWNDWSTRDIVNKIGQLDYTYGVYYVSTLASDGCYLLDIFTTDVGVRSYLQRFTLEQLRYINELLVKHLKKHRIKKYLDKLEIYRTASIEEMLSESDSELSYDLLSQFNIVSHTIKFLEEELHDLYIREGHGPCAGNENCEALCDDLFGGSRYEECLDLTWNEVQGMWNAFDEDSGILEDPDEYSLNTIRLRDIRNALEIDDRIWDSFIDDYGPSEAIDGLYWISKNECIYEAIENSFDRDDVMKSFMEDFFNQVDSAGLLAAALEPLGDEADNDETFLYLANQEGNDGAVELVHGLLWKECLSENASLSCSS